MGKAVQQPVARLITAQELLYMTSERDEHYELDRGVLVVREPPGFSHGQIQVAVCTLLYEHVKRHRLGTVVVESGYVLERGPDTVRGPDVSFVRADRLHGRLPDQFWNGAPDLAVEVLSPSDRPAEMEHKVRQYLQTGCRMVWILDPRARTVTVWEPDRIPVRLESHQCLEGGDVVPGFRCLVGLLFAE